jgi:hypothetical protein
VDLSGIMRKSFLSFMAVVFAGAMTVSAQEHPTSKKSVLTNEALADAVTDYVKRETNLKGGYFLFFNSKQNMALALTLNNVHKERLATLGGGIYFACADFKSVDDDTYDLDIFMKEDEHGLEIYDIDLHKKNGQARYVWVEKKGIWSKKEQ